MITDSADRCIPAEDKVTNTTTEDHREDHKTTVCRTKVRILRFIYFKLLLTWIA